MTSKKYLSLASIYYSRESIQCTTTDTSVSFITQNTIATLLNKYYIIPLYIVEELSLKTIIKNETLCKTSFCVTYGSIQCQTCRSKSCFQTTVRLDRPQKECCGWLERFLGVSNDFQECFTADS
jgi:hypothetical protein